MNEEKLQGIYENCDQSFNVVYPNSTSATYSSLLNYSDDLTKPYQRWYRYKEGFSTELVKQLIAEYCTKNKDNVILDPFCGSGSTLLAARNMGYDGIGYEVNPFSFFLSKCKLGNYNKNDCKNFQTIYKTVLDSWDKYCNQYTLPMLSISSKVFPKDIEMFYMSVDYAINHLDSKYRKVQGLMKLGLLSCLEELSNYRKAGNGLKIKHYVKPKKLTVDDAITLVRTTYEKIYDDISVNNVSGSVKVYNKSCLDMSDIPNGYIDGIIFSPPYANCFDYTEIYKLELWFGGFVHDYIQMKKLRQNSLHSHLNGILSQEVVSKSSILDGLLGCLDVDMLWDKKIPSMLRMYYSDMFKVLDECYRVSKHNSFCCVVVGNSSYGGVVFPADLILADYARRIGFIVDKIEVDRYIITSSQQYNITKNIGKFLRESVVCLMKQ